MGGATVVFGTLGILAGGRTAEWLKRRGRLDANMRVGIIASWLALVAAVPLYLSDRFALLIAGLVLTNIGAALPWGAAAAALQEITPAPMRSQTSALYLFVINVVGGLGAVTVALVTDHVLRDEGRVGISLFLVTVVGRALSAVLLARGLPAFRRGVASFASNAPPTVAGE
jgi:hypothetical protein